MKLFTLIHVLISLVGILSGGVVLQGMLKARRLDRWTTIFLATTVATSVTGFLFPFHGFTPALGTGILSMVALAIAIYALYDRKLTGIWRKTYVISAVFSLYLNVFVLVVQLFLHVPAIHALAPKQTEPPFVISQLLVLVTFIALGIQATKKFHNEEVRLLVVTKV